VLITQKDGLLADLERGQRELEEVSAECESAKGNLVKFRAEIRNLEREKLRMLAQLANARARRRIQSAFEGLSTEGEMRALESVREEIERMKAEAKIDTDMDSGLEQRVRAIRDEAKLDAARRDSTSWAGSKLLFLLSAPARVDPAYSLPPAASRAGRTLPSARAFGSPGWNGRRDGVGRCRKAQVQSRLGNRADICAGRETCVLGRDLFVCLISRGAAQTRCRSRIRHTGKVSA
jgi:hypothetical protein